MSKKFPFPQTPKARHRPSLHRPQPLDGQTSPPATGAIAAGSSRVAYTCMSPPLPSHPLLNCETGHFRAVALSGLRKVGTWISQETQMPKQSSPEASKADPPGSSAQLAGDPDADPARPGGRLPPAQVTNHVCQRSAATYGGLSTGTTLSCTGCTESLTPQPHTRRHAGGAEASRGHGCPGAQGPPPLSRECPSRPSDAPQQEQLRSSLQPCLAIPEHSALAVPSHRQ